MTKTTLPAGGRATEAGMAFQAGVGLWFAAHLLARMPVGSRFGLDVAAYPVSLQLESGVGLDDIVVRLSNGGKIALQCKTRPNLSASEASDLGKTLAQTIQFIADAQTSTSFVDLQRSAAVMAVASDAPATLNGLDEVCRMFATGDHWSEIFARVSQAQRSAMSILLGHVTRAHTAKGLPPPTDPNLAQVARLFHIERFAVSQGEADWREASNVLGSRLYGTEEHGVAPLASLLTIVRDLIRSAAPADRDGLLRLLRADGHEDIKSPQYDDSIAALRGKTRSEIARLQRHAVLPIANGVQIERVCMPAIKAAAEAGSFLVVGEPGAGKTGVLIALVRERLAANLTTVFISADDLAGIVTDDALRIALNLRHPLIEVLAAWPGRSRGVLVIDALDASRGGHSETVFARLIETVHTKLQDRWSVVASIRTFDLKNGKRFRRAMGGAPPNPAYVDKTATDVMHFLVHPLTNEEVDHASHREARIGELLTTAPKSVRDLLRNIFNLSLVAELLDGGTAAASIATVTTQSDLIDRYEDERLPTTDLQTSVARTVEVMVKHRRLERRKVDVAHPALDAVLASGVLVASGDKVRFAHHILFDHAASRYFLDWNDPSQLVMQLSGSDGLGLLLGPSLRFVIERIWREDTVGRPVVWGLVTAFLAAAGIDPVASSAVLRSTTEHVEGPDDVTSLCCMLAQPNQVDRMGPALSKLARFMGLSIAAQEAVTDSLATAWANVAAAAADTQQYQYADGVRIILFNLFETANFTNPTLLASFGRATRGLLNLIWSGDPRVTGSSSSAIRFVAKSYGSDPVASRCLLQQILDEPRFSAHAHDEAVWLAERVHHIIPHDPAFVTSIYAALFGRPAPSDGETWMNESRIIPLLSNRRQDYEHGRWQLKKALPSFLETSPAEATKAVNAAVIGISSDSRYASRSPQVIRHGNKSIAIAEDGMSLMEWRGSDDASEQPGQSVLSIFAAFLQECRPEEFRKAAISILQEDVASASVWARILGIAADRPGIADDLLWPIGTAPQMGHILDVTRDCAIYLASAYATASTKQRAEFETLMVDHARSSDTNEAEQTRRFAARLLSILPDDLIATPAFRDLKARLDANGDLTGNHPYMTIGDGWEESRGITERLVGSQGANVAEGPDRQVLDARQALETLLKQTPKSASADLLARLWDQVLATVAAIDGLTLPAHEATLHASWGYISNAVERIAEAESYDPANAHPTLEAIVDLLDRLAHSIYPEPRSKESEVFFSWGNLDVRVYAASGFMQLACRFANSDSTLFLRLEAMLDDAEATVRHQVSASLNRLWNVDRERMWTLMKKVALQETDRRTMGYFVLGALSRVATTDPEGAEPLLETVIQRFPPKGSGDLKRECELEQALGFLATRLYVGQGNVACLAHLQSWLRNTGTAVDLLCSGVSTLREALFLGYKENAKAEDIKIQKRALEVLGLVVDAAAKAKLAALSTYNISADRPQERAISEREYISTERLLKYCVDQLYFGAGVFSGTNDQRKAALDSAATKRSFLHDYQNVLVAIGQSGGPATIHHLVELYEFVLDSNPEAVFDQITSLLVGPAAREGYHLESLGLDVVVRIIRRYLADHRNLFDNPTRRTALIEVLRLFSERGWPEAIKLLYELPELMR